MSLYGEYLKEKSTDEIIEMEHGFATYRLLNENKSVYIVDLYVQPEFRKMGIASKMADAIVDICKIKGAKELIGTVIPSAKNSTESMQVLFAYGLKLFASNPDMIYLRKDI